ncbi:MAG: hypothetical protein EA427_00155 [Spirochaetaceae bacterium]|nr:MAG: hypothetical protein EA427_00155 [Spirochaetaceae bacterium]
MGPNTMGPNWKSIACILILAVALVASVSGEDWDEGDWDSDGWDDNGWDTDSWGAGDAGWDDDASWAGDGWDDNGWDTDSWGAGDGWGGAAPAGLDLSGYLETTGLTVLPRNPRRDEADLGLQTLLRVRGRFEPDSFLSVTVETEFLDRRGAADPGAGGAGGPGAPGSRQIYFDYLYGSAAFGPVDLRVGRQPLAWGTAYALNPTDLMNPVTVAGLAGVEPPGITAISSSVTLGERMGLEGYLGFEDRSRHPAALEGLSRLEKLPWGVRGRAFLGMWDLGIGLARSAERDVAGESAAAIRTEDYVVAEVVGSIGPVLLYGEAAIEAGTGDWHVSRSVDGAAGAQWDPLERLSLQAEYHRRGRGSTDVEDYALEDRLARRLVGRDYLVGIVTLSMMEEDLRLIAASLINLNDGSAAVLPELTYRVTDDFQTSLGGSWPLGPRGSEFDGRLQAGDAEEIDLGRPRVFLRATWYF